MTTLLSPKTLADMPGPTTPPLVQLLEGIFWPHKGLEKAFREYGDLFHGDNPGFPPMAIASSPKAIEAIFGADPNLFESGSGNKMLQPLLGQESLLQIDGPQHRKRRKLLMPSFHGQSVQAYGQVMREITEQVMAPWRSGQVFPIHQAMQEITLRVILKTVFGLRQGERYETLRVLLSNLLNSFNSPWRSTFLFLPALQKDLGPWSPWGSFLRGKRQIDQLLLAEIQERRRESGQGDILSLLLAATDEQGEALSDTELRDELMTLLFAGHETTATTLAWAMYWIHRQPQIRQKLMLELAELGPEPELMAVAKLPYLDAVCNETLRYYPVVLFTFGRILQQPFELLGYRLEAGVMLLPCIYLLHHHPKVYPDSKTFRPERFIERQYSPYEFIPFGGGNRRCLGYAFAQFEMKVVLSQMLTNAQFSLASDRPIYPVRRGVTFMPSEGVKVRVK